MENYLTSNPTEDSGYLLSNDSVQTVPPVNRLHSEMAAYSALLSSEQPMETYNRIMSDYENVGRSDYVDNVINVINKEENEGTRQAMVSIIEDQTLSKEEKWSAIQYYQQNREVLPSLREKYSLTVASTSPTVPLDPQVFAEGYFARELAAEEIQNAINADASQWSESQVSAMGGFLLEIIPFVGTGYKGAQLTKMMEALDGNDRGAIETVWNGIMSGSSVEDIRNYIASLPTESQKVEATKKLLNALKEFPGTDYNRWTAIVKALDTETGYETWEKYLDNTLGIVGAVWGASGIARSVKAHAPKITKTVDPQSILGITARGNSKFAGQLTGTAVVDETGEVARALGETHKSIISSIMPKVDEEVVDAVTSVESNVEMMKIIDELDSDALQALEKTERAAVMYTDELKDEVSQLVYGRLSSTTGASLHLGKSTIKVADDIKKTDWGVEGQAVFGKTSGEAYGSYSEALAAAKELEKQLPEGVLEIVKPGRGGKLRPGYSTTDKGEHYIKYSFKKDINPQDIVLYGPDAVNVKATIFGKEIGILSSAMTRMARMAGGKVGSYMFAHQHLPKAATDTAFASFEKAFATEKTFLDYAHNYLTKQSAVNRQTIAELLHEGENFVENGVKVGKVFTYDEVIKKGLAKGLTQSEAEEMAKGYYVYRRTADWMYTALDRQKSRQFREGGYVWYHREGNRFMGKAVGKSDVEKVKATYDPISNKVEPINTAEIEHLYNNGGTLVRLGHSYRHGDEIVEYARVGATKETSEILQGAVPYVKGWVPRMYDNTYFVTRTPRGVVVNGEKLSGDSTASYRTTHYATESKADALRKADELNKADPTGHYEWKRERLNENTILNEHDVMRQNRVHSLRRGDEALEGGRTLDPLEALQKTITSLSQKAAMEEFLIATRADFVRQYNRFLAKKGTFPAGRSDIVAPSNMTGEEAKQLANAHAVYNWLEGMTLMTRYDTALWKDAMYAAGEWAEKFSPNLAKLFQAVGKHYPVDYLRRMATALFISMRPARQLLLQPSQLFVLPAVDPSLLNPVNSVRFFRQVTALQPSMLYKSGNALNKVLNDDALITVGAKMFGTTEKEYKAIVTSLKDSGILASVDTHTVIDGWYLNKGMKLSETAVERGTRLTKNVLSTPAKVGRSVGFDFGERFNLIGSWVMARNRYMKMNPKADMTSKQVLEQITADAKEIAWSMSRPGSFQYQRNAMSLPLQFLAAPHKALLSMTTSKFWTPAEKARLAVGHFVLYGSAGLGLMAITDKVKNEFGTKLDKDTWKFLEGGVLDWGVNAAINSLLHDENGKTDLDLARTFSPMSNGPTPFGEFLISLTEEPAATVILGPSWNIVDPQKGRLVTAVRDISGIFKTEDINTSEKFKQASLRAAELASGGTDYMKFSLAWNLHKTVASNGHTIDDEATAAEAVAKLFGIGSARERKMREINQRIWDEEKEMKDTAKFIYDEMLRASRTYGDNREEWLIVNQRLSAFLSLEKDEFKRKAIAKHINELARQAVKSGEYSFHQNIYSQAQYRSAEFNRALYNTLVANGYDEAASQIKLLIGED